MSAPGNGARPGVEDVDLAFAVCQGVYGRLAEQVRTGTPGNLRAVEDAISLEAFERDGSTQRAITVNGETVGRMTVLVEEGPRVADMDAYMPWAEEAGLVDERVEVNLSALDETMRTYALEALHDVVPYAVRVVREPRPLGSCGFAHRGGSVVWPETGEEVPGLEWSRRAKGTKLTGVRWDGARGFPAVGAALEGAGVGPGEVVAMLTEGGAD